MSQLSPKTERKALFALALPMILSNITVPLLGLVDTGVIGHLPNAYFLGATAVGSMIITFITWFCGFLRMSTSGLAAQAYGRDNRQQILLVLSQGLFVAVAMGLLLVLLQTPYIDLALWLSGGSDNVQLYARQYSEIRIWGLPAALANLVILGWLLGLHRAKYAMWLLIVTNVINLSLDLLFVLVFKWQVMGVATATLIAEYSCFVLGLWLVSKTLNVTLKDLSKALAATKQSLFNKANFSPYLKLNSNIVIRTLCLEICFVFITFQGARLGDTVVAANAILLNFLLLISFGLDGIAYGVEARVGRAIGAKDSKSLMLSVKTALSYSLIFACIYSVFFYAFGLQFIALLTDIVEVADYASEFMPWIVALPILACWCYLFDGVYIGLTRADIMRNTMLISTFGCFFPCWFVLQEYGNHGLWAAFSVFMVVRGITLFIHYQRHKNSFCQ